MSDDDGMCCTEITIVTNACRVENGYSDPSAWLFMFHLTRADGNTVSWPLGSVERMVELVRELNPPTVHVFAMPDEHGPLMAEVRAQAASDMTAALFNAPAAPSAALH